MGLLAKQRQWREEASLTAVYRTNQISNGVFRHLPKGGTKAVEFPIAGAHAVFERGAPSERTSLSNVIVGAAWGKALGGDSGAAAGAVLGGMAKEDTSRRYVTVTFRDGSVVTIDGPAKKEKKLLAFADAVNRISAHYAALEAAEPATDDETPPEA